MGPGVCPSLFQEDKLSRSPINKDFIYSAEGGAVPVTSNTQFLGTIAPYAGDFGISKNPQSFAAYGYSRYFTDKNISFLSMNICNLKTTR